MPCQSPPGYTCFCHYKIEENANIYNCSSSSVPHLPHSYPLDTDWLVIKNDIPTKLNDSFDSGNSIWYLDVSKSQVIEISNEFINNLKSQNGIQWLNLQKNNLTSIPSNIQDLNYLQKIWVSENPIDCNCEMIWMIGWLNNFKTLSGEHIIQDYKYVVCHSGLNIGDPIYKLDEVDMGCYPHVWTTWQILLFTLETTAGILIIAVLAMALVRKSRSVRFFFFHKLKVRSALYWDANDAEEQNPKNMKYDAYLSYRYCDHYKHFC